MKYQSSTYSSKIKYIIFSFFISAYNYSNIFVFPKLQTIEVICSLFYVNNKFNFLRQFFFLLFSFCRYPFLLRRLKFSTSKEWQMKFVYLKRLLFLYYEKFIFFVYPQLQNNPIVADFHANDYFSFTLKGFTSLEERILFKRPVEIHIAANIEVFWFFLPKWRLSIYEERNFLRLINVPLLWKT
jgi:hypothetical protein